MTGASSGETLGLLLVIGAVVVFAWTNGFHDASNAVATSVSTKALTPRIALVMATLANLLGALFGQRVATTVGSDLLVPPTGGAGLALLAGALVGAVCWNLLTWRLGLPSSSTHALVGGLAGAAIVAGASVRWGAILTTVVVPMLVSPVLGFALAWLTMYVLVRWLRERPVAELNRGFRYAQTVSAVAVAFGHGMQDAAKSAGVITLALVATGRATGPEVDWWALGLAAAAMAAGTYAGGWRVMRTLGRGLVRIGPAQGFAAEAVSSVLLYAATALRLPISTTYVVTAAIAGAGTATRGHLAVRWGMGGRIVLAWLLTLPAAGVVAAAAYGILSVAVR